MTDTDRMVAWLRETLDAAERVAQAAREGGKGRWQQADPERMPGFITGDHDGYHVAYDEGYPTLEQATHIVLHDPAAVLRRIDRHRKILDEHPVHHYDAFGPRCKTCKGGAVQMPSGVIDAGQPYPCATVRNLAEAWGWKEETGSASA